MVQLGKRGLRRKAPPHYPLAQQSQRYGRELGPRLRPEGRSDLTYSWRKLGTRPLRACPIAPLCWSGVPFCPRALTSSRCFGDQDGSVRFTCAGERSLDLLQWGLIQ